VQTRADGVLSGRDAILRIRQARPIGVHTSGYQIGLLPCTYQSRLGSADVRRPPFGANDPAAPAGPPGPFAATGGPGGPLHSIAAPVTEVDNRRYGLTDSLDEFLAEATAKVRRMAGRPGPRSRSQRRAW
jgi:hypothetical protein